MEGGGRLINMVVEKAPAGARGKFIWRRAPGLVAATATATTHRGSILVGSVLYEVAGTKAYTITKNSAGVYTVVELTGDPIGGTGPVFIDRNMNASPQILIRHSDGYSQINTSLGTVADFSDPDLPAGASLNFCGGYFFVVVGDGRCFASGLNAVTFNANDMATAEQSPDGLVRGVRYGRYQLLMGTKTIEFWSNAGNPAGFPFTFATVIPIGLLTAHAVAGFELGFTRGLIFVASDRTVQVLAGGTAAEKISTPDLDRKLEEVADVTDLEMAVFVAAGHSYAVLTCDTGSPGSSWSWVYSYPDNTAPGGWQERRSYGAATWRGRLCVNAFDEWLAFDRTSSALLRIDARAQKEATSPLVWEIWSTLIHAAPTPIEFNRVFFDFMTGVGRDAGINPIETDPRVLVSCTDDGGLTRSNEREGLLGTQGEATTVEFYLEGQSGDIGRQYIIRMSDPVETSLMGGAFDGGPVQ